MALGEFELIAKFFTDIGRARADIALGIGDDCALLNPPAGQQLAISVDTLIADVHFPAHGNAALIAQKALRSNLSDLAAMGATPLAFTLALTLPHADTDWLAQFAQGLRACADEFDITLIGGDTTRGPVLVMTIQIIGTLPHGQALLRSGAKVGDSIFVTGTLGDARAALDYLTLPHNQLTAIQQYFLQRYFTPLPRVQFAQQLRGIAHAAIDISDGLAADLGHILECSHVGARIEPVRLPLSDALRTHPDAHEFALHGGDDYELCFTVPHERLPQLHALAQQSGVRVTKIGEISEGSELLAVDAQGNVRTLVRSGYTHF
jgi:thiamine-monophosphate kinase